MMGQYQLVDVRVLQDVERHVLMLQLFYLKCPMPQQMASQDLHAQQNKCNGMHEHKKNVPGLLSNIAACKKPTLEEPTEMPSGSNRFPIVKYNTHKEFVEAFLNSPVKQLCLTGTLLYETVNANPQPVKPIVKPQHQQHFDDAVSCPLCLKFYEIFVALSTHTINNISNQTTSQSDDIVWQDSRKVRITSSTAKSVPKNATTHPSNLVKNHLFSSFRGTTATKHGKVNEYVARKQYEETDAVEFRVGLNSALPTPSVLHTC